MNNCEPQPVVIDDKDHMICRYNCNKCGAVISEYHFGCCGHMMSGWNKSKHECITNEPTSQDTNC